MVLQCETDILVRERPMAVCFEPMDSIVILDDEEEEERPQTSFSSARASSSSSARPSSTNHVTPPKVQLHAPTHITQSPFATAKKESHVLQAENQRLFSEFVQHCSTHTEDCPEVMTFLHAKHAKASPDFLASVEFRNTLGRCLTRAQASRAKTFVYINELCTVLKQHTAKRRQELAKAKASSSSNAAKKDVKVKKDVKEEEPSTSGQQDVKEEEKKEEEEVVDEEKERKTKKASRRQIAYLENLLKVYNDEIRRLQEKEMSIDELMAEDSGYIQEHKLKRKMMKIYEKLCELKGCGTQTGRAIEQRIPYSGTRHPEINRRIERFINSPDSRLNPPDYGDILQQVQQADARHQLSLSRKQMGQIAQDAFRDTGNRLQERRHQDLVYNFGSHLTDLYKHGTDPAMKDRALEKLLRSNREVSLSSLEQVISRYALQQDDTEEQDRKRRLEKKEQAQKSEGNGVGTSDKKEGEGPAEGEEPAEEEDDEDDESSDPDIEEEIQASEEQVQNDGDEEDDDEDDNEAEPVNESEKEPDGESETSARDAADKPPAANGLSPASDDNTPGLSPLTDDPSPTDSPSQSEPVDLDKDSESANHSKKEDVSSNHTADVSVSTSMDTFDLPHLAANQVSLPPSPVVLSTNEDTVQLIRETRSANCSPRPPSPVASRSRKRKREERSQAHKRESEVDIPLDMGVACSPLQADSTRADTPQQEVVTSSQSTPPPKKNKVNVATQCDPDEIIVLSDCD